MHLVTTDKQKEQLSKGDAVEKHKQELMDYISREMEHVVYIEDDLIDPTDSLKQMGRSMTSAEMEKRLIKIVPSNVAFIDNPFNPTKKAVILIKGLNERETICAYERGIQPEHSILQLVVKEVPDPDVISRKKSISRLDMPKSEFIPGRGFVFDDSVTRPGFKKIKQLGREIKRGWRTVLIRLLAHGLISIADVERVFGNENTATWQQNALGANNNIPW